MIKPKHKDCGCLPSPRPVFSNSFPSIELTENQSYMPGFPSSRLSRFASEGAARLALGIRISCSICLCASFCNLVQLTCRQASRQAGRDQSLAWRPRPRFRKESALLS
nr:unnamed protein product [Mus musculus]